MISTYEYGYGTMKAVTEKMIRREGLDKAIDDLAFKLAVKTMMNEVNDG